MIKKTLITFFILFVAYTIIVTYILYPDRYISEHQWQDNQIKTQNYLFSNNSDSINSIIVGSSLSERLRMEMLPQFYNLGLLGLGPADGLFAIHAKGNYPRYIYVEINHIDRPLNEELTTSIDNPLMTPLRRHLVSLRDGKQPMSLIAIPYGQKATAYGIYLMQTALSKVIAKQTKDTSNRVNMLDKMLDQSIEYHNKIPDNLETATQTLKLYIDEMTRNGSTVVFFEMPIQYQLCGLERSQAIRNQMYKAFPKDKYKYINIPDCKDYTTTDGEHLDYTSAERYTLYFKEKIKEMY